MLGAPKTVALFGRFRLLGRADIARLLVEQGIRAVKDLTRTSDILAIGSGATNLIAGPLPKRLAEARALGIPVLGEARLLQTLQGREDVPGTLALSSVPGADAGLADMLNAFDLVRISAGRVRFQDADVLRTASQFSADGFEMAQIVSALLERRQAPKGRHRLGLNDTGAPVLIWEDGLTTVTGQGLLPLAEDAGLDERFEDALAAEADGTLSEAARLYELCTKHDKRDPIAPFNLGNVRMRMQDTPGAILAYQIALARQSRFPEAHFNLALCLEEQGKAGTARTHLKAALEVDPGYDAALFNLAQIDLAAGAHKSAAEHFARFASRAKDAHLVNQAKRALRLIEAERAEK